MITRETHYMTYPWDFYFRVIDDKEKIVVIELENEWSVASAPCKEWEEGVADALLKASKFTNLVGLLFEVYNKNMISNRRLLHEKFREIIEKNKRGE